MAENHQLAEHNLVLIDRARSPHALVGRMELYGNLVAEVLEQKHVEQCIEAVAGRALALDMHALLELVQMMAVKDVRETVGQQMSVFEYIQSQV